MKFKWYNFRLKAGHFCFLLIGVWSSLNIFLTDAEDIFHETLLPELIPAQLQEFIPEDIYFILFADSSSSSSAKMEENLNGLAMQNEYAFHFYKAYVTESSEIIRDYKLSGLPSTLIFKNGEEVKRIHGVVPASTLKHISKKLP